MSVQKINIRNQIDAFNRSELRHQLIPMEMASGWPCIHRVGNTLCMTIPYFSRTIGEDGKVLLNPLYCSVTMPVMNPQRLLDFTIFSMQHSWDDIAHDQPAGSFPHKALEGVKRGEYNAMCDQLYDCYDDMVDAVRNGRPFEKIAEMKSLFSSLMEPAHYPQYLRINKKFYSTVCGL